ncbi:NAD(P)/FAD-dependent oxidoreductase [Erythrobacteraceae bacterium CFH 75059]|uniref:NAD(P)/FAD-dependent oxidoreductase n=1 Tax=Qipengyuania thermophila TaxID=2509361 RepID=UPI0010213B54|nr:NAD(P)/FAD-dependent oxidoreductase [Qipengyuania thermophila]TCD05384.1 NAD(P)/FAD-dependent oxidoreductase [Erythrobacteraceae bacterium CFH 75059]
MEDCIIIGGGPAGLTAAIYLARYHLDIRLFDCGTSRAALIPCTHNHAGYPDGIAGTELVERMRRQAEKYGARREEKRVEKLERDEEGFRVHAQGQVFRARSVLLATGVFNLHPPGMDDALHDEALRRGALRYCPVCDGYEVTDKRVGVIGTRQHGTAETLFIRTFTRDLTLIAPDAEHDLDAECITSLDEAGVARVDGPCGRYRLEGDRLAVETARGWMSFDSVYPALGSHIRSELAVALGARANEDGRLEVSDHLETSVRNLFAAGDVVEGLDQISNAMGQAGVAATRIRNRLAEERAVWR